MYLHRWTLQSRVSGVGNRGTRAQLNSKLCVAALALIACLHTYSALYQRDTIGSLKPSRISVGASRTHTHTHTQTHTYAHTHSHTHTHAHTHAHIHTRTRTHPPYPITHTPISYIDIYIYFFFFLFPVENPFSSASEITSERTTHVTHEAGWEWLRRGQQGPCFAANGQF